MLWLPTSSDSLQTFLDRATVGQSRIKGHRVPTHGEIFNPHLSSIFSVFVFALSLSTPAFLCPGHHLLSAFSMYFSTISALLISASIAFAAPRPQDLAGATPGGVDEHHRHHRHHGHFKPIFNGSASAVGNSAPFNLTTGVMYILLLNSTDAGIGLNATDSGKRESNRLFPLTCCH